MVKTLIIHDLNLIKYLELKISSFRIVIQSEPDFSEYFLDYQEGKILLIKYVILPASYNCIYIGWK